MPLHNEKEINAVCFFLYFDFEIFLFSHSFKHVKEYLSLLYDENNIHVFIEITWCKGNNDEDDSLKLVKKSKI